MPLLTKSCGEPSKLRRQKHYDVPVGNLISRLVSKKGTNVTVFVAFTPLLGRIQVGMNKRLNAVGNS